MYDIHVFQKFKKREIKLLIIQATDTFVDTYFEKHGYITKKTSQIY